ncbi:hypothetical protein SISSUDRAFT_1053516 [Sistotremastrum suecicum HHB10207 ss-3]|uniref:Uncharacterized protein n=1 Tax=Sistotremastrum suecicum HHB10207 ss-3 TaxID=1314776 RepID=A0A165Z5S6_9AGAM|nr:hypothetical protein SISSUDRAFT_1053516 [Sistotremastrum suecicum HHB10207 ss-3]
MLANCIDASRIALPLGQNLATIDPQALHRYASRSVSLRNRLKSASPSVSCLQQYTFEVDSPSRIHLFDDYLVVLDETGAVRVHDLVTGVVLVSNPSDTDQSAYWCLDSVYELSQDNSKVVMACRWSEEGGICRLHIFELSFHGEDGDPNHTLKYQKSIAIKMPEIWYCNPMIKGPLVTASSREAIFICNWQDETGIILRMPHDLHVHLVHVWLDPEGPRLIIHATAPEDAHFLRIFTCDIPTLMPAISSTYAEILIQPHIVYQSPRSWRALGLRRLYAGPSPWVHHHGSSISSVNQIPSTTQRLNLISASRKGP